MTLDLPITPEQYAQIQQNQAVVITHYQGPQGRFAKLDFIGTLEECEAKADTPELVIMPTGVECEGKVVVPVAELLPPDSAEAPV